VALADAGRSEGQHVHRAIREGARRQLPQLRHQRARQALGAKGPEGLARRKQRGPAKAVDTALMTALLLALEDLQHDPERVVVADLLQARAELLGHHREPKEVPQLLQPLRAALVEDRGAHDASAVSSWS
jgi:hypothetical protein